MEFVEFSLEDEDPKALTGKWPGEPGVYRLIYDFNEIVEAEGITGCNLLQAISLPRAMTAAQMRGLLYAALRSAHPLVLLKDAGELLSRDTKTVSDALAACLFSDTITEPTGEDLKLATEAAEAVR